jgi:hypothetical protein
MKKFLAPPGSSTARRPSIRNRLWRITPPARRRSTTNGLHAVADAAQILVPEGKESERGEGGGLAIDSYWLLASPDDETGVGFLDGPRRREMALLPDTIAVRRKLIRHKGESHVVQICDLLLSRNRLRCHDRIDAYRRVRWWPWRRGQCAATRDLELAALC